MHLDGSQEEEGNFLDLLQKEGGTQKEGGLPALEETMMYIYIYTHVYIYIYIYYNYVYICMIYIYQTIYNLVSVW